LELPQRSLMGAPKQKWTEEEEIALKAGVQKHGVGKWRAIQKDPCFKSALSSRTNVDLKDKWRNLNIDLSASPRTPVRVKIGEKRARTRPDSEPFRSRKLHVDHDKPQKNNSKKMLQLNGHRNGHSNVLDVQLYSPKNLLKTLEHMIVAAIIALDDEKGLTLGDTVLWIEEHCGIPRESQGTLQSTLSSLVSRRRLSETAGRYALGGVLVKYMKEENMTVSTLKKQNQVESCTAQAKIAALAAFAALAVMEAEEAADKATKLTEEADRLKAADRLQQQAFLSEGRSTRKSQPCGSTRSLVNGHSNKAQLRHAHQMRPSHNLGLRTLTNGDALDRTVNPMALAV